MLLFRRYVPLSVFGTVLILAGCSEEPADPESPNFIVAEGKNVQVTRQEINEKLDKIMQAEGLRRDMYPPERLQQYEATLAKMLVRSKLILNQKDEVDLSGLEEQVNARLQEERSKHVNELMFEQHLARNGWQSVDDYRESLTEAATVDRILEAKTEEVEEPSEEQITEMYQSLLPSLPEREEQVRASHILVRVNTDEDEKTKKEKRKQVEQARKRVQGGEDFAAVAKEVSEDVYSAPKGGDLAYFTRGQRGEEFDSVAFKTKVGQVSEVFETPYGFHILKVTDHREPGTMTLAELRPELVQYYRSLEKAKRKMAYLDQAVEEAEVTYNIDMAPPLNGPPAESQPGAGNGAIPGAQPPVPGAEQ